jgi:hypothetical protein
MDLVEIQSPKLDGEIEFICCHSLAHNYHTYENDKEICIFVGIIELIRKSLKKVSTCSLKQYGSDLGHYIFINVIIEMYIQN